MDTLALIALALTLPFFALAVWAHREQRKIIDRVKARGYWTVELPSGRATWHGPGDD